jgi:TPR repeat protein
MAMSNVAAAYRIVGKARLSARWFQRAAQSGDGDALTDWGYCLQHGAGVRKDLPAAEQAYRAALRARLISEYGREEAMYHLAVLLFRRRSAASRRAAVRFLKRASADGDYPQAAALLNAIEVETVPDICVCRRYLRPRLAQSYCPLHQDGRLRGKLKAKPERFRPTANGRE